MMSKIDWQALETIHDRSTHKGNAIAEHFLELQIELAEERAAIMQYDSGLSREKAEAYAFRRIKTIELERQQRAYSVEKLHIGT